MTDLSRRHAITATAAGALATCLPSAAGAMAPQPGRDASVLLPKGPNDRRLWELLEEAQACHAELRRLTGEDEATETARGLVIDREFAAYAEMERTHPDSWSGVNAMARTVRAYHWPDEPWEDTFNARHIPEIAGKVMEIFSRPWLLRVEG